MTEAENIGDIIDRMQKTKGEHYALAVKGESMSGFGFHDDDVVIVMETSEFIEGSFSVISDGEQSTFCKLESIEGQTFITKHDGALKREIWHSVDGFEIKGVLVGLIRTFENLPIPPQTEGAE